MTKRIKRINYRERYPDVSNDIIEVLEKSDRKMEYQQYDLKVERYRIDCTKRSVTLLPSREDSYERLLEEKHQFALESETVEEAAIKTVLIEKMLICLKSLSEQEQELIFNVFFLEKTQIELEDVYKISQQAISKRLKKTLKHLAEIMEI
ncbi:hypothetical protein BN3590_02751 [Clostridium sp. C105KSO15]|nr:hypothetical protein BN3590_02751 [Clostridium sp. C105KSO15]